MRLNKGFSLVSLLVGVATSSALLLTIAQLTGMSRANFFKNEKTVALYVNARDAIGVLRQYVPMAGVGIVQPMSAEIISIGFKPVAQISPIYPSGGQSNAPILGAATLKDWVYVGYYLGITGSNTVGGSYAASAANPWMPNWCAAAISASSTAAQSSFMGLSQNNCYYGASNVGLSLASASTYKDGACCPNSSSSTTCVDPVYSCGATDENTWDAAVYQRLIQPLSVTKNPGKDRLDDSLTVYFVNTGPQKMTSYGGGDIAIDAHQVPDLAKINSYTFQVNQVAGQSVLQLTDSVKGETYTIAQNVEQMYVLVGESDRIQTQKVTTNQTMQLPEMNRYVHFSTTNVYPYRINAVRIALVVASEDGLTAKAAAKKMNVMRGNDRAFITYTPASADRRLRKVFVTTIYLNAYGLPEYRMHCAPGVSGGYRLKRGGIPFVSTVWNKQTDQCCGSCTNFSSFALCEAQRMRGSC